MWKLKNFISYIPFVGRLTSQGVGTATKASTEGMTKATAKIYNGFVKSHNPKTMGPLDDLAKDRYKALAQDGAEAMGGSLLGKIAGWAGLGGAGTVIGLTADAGFRGQNSIAGRTFRNISEGAKNIDAQTDLGGFFVRIGEFFRNLVKLFQNFGSILNGDKSVKEIFSKTGEETNDNLTVTSTDNNTPDNSRSLAQSFTDYSVGLIKDADPRQWTIEGGLNLANAAGNGAVVGTTSALAWVGGQALDIINVGNVFSDTDFSSSFSKATSEATNKAWEKTIGGPNLNGHWAHALNKTSEFAVPTLGAIKIGKALSNAFGFATSTARGSGVADKVVTNAPTIAAAP